MPYFKDPSNNKLHFLTDKDLENNGKSLLPTSCIEITDDEANSIITSYAVPSSSKLAEQLKLGAQLALTKSDITILRCYESKVEIPKSWVEYRLALRNIISGTSEKKVLPTQPPYPTEA